MDLPELFLAAAASVAPVGTPIDRPLVEREQVRSRVRGGRPRQTGHRKNRAASAGSGRGSADSQTGIGFESCRSGAKPGSGLSLIAKVCWSRRETALSSTQVRLKLKLPNSIGLSRLVRRRFVLTVLGIRFVAKRHLA